MWGEGVDFSKKILISKLTYITMLPKKTSWGGGEGGLYAKFDRQMDTCAQRNQWCKSEFQMGGCFYGRDKLRSPLQSNCPQYLSRGGFQSTTRHPHHKGVGEPLQPLESHIPDDDNNNNGYAI